VIWNDETIELLTELWTQGMSASLIADEVSKHTGTRVSRNAIIGKAHRLKLSPHVVSEQRRPLPPHRLPRRMLLIQPHQVVTVVVQPKLRRRRKHNITLFDLRQDSCRWPVSAEGEPYRFCGAAAQGIYCAEHGELAWQKKIK